MKRILRFLKKIVDPATTLSSPGTTAGGLLGSIGYALSHSPSPILKAAGEILIAVGIAVFGAHSK